MNPKSPTVHTDRHYDVAIVGGGISGTALLYVLATYTSVKRVLLLEKYADFAQVSSHYKSNSQTLHYGDIETNYTVEKAQSVKQGAEMVAVYAEKHGGDLFKKRPKMVLAVGEKEVRELEERYESIKTLFPRLKKLDRDGIRRIEPHVVEGRDPDEPILALYAEETGYIMNFQKLAQLFAREALRVRGKQLNVKKNTLVKSIVHHDTGYKLSTTEGDYTADVVVVSAGGNSLMFAYELGFGKDYIILPVAGDFFFCTRPLLKGKVYTMQLPDLPFAAIHGDVEVTDDSIIRFGPVPRIVPYLEPRNPSSFRDFMRVFSLRWRAITTLCSLFFAPRIFLYMTKNMMYYLPWIGKRLFARWEARKIVPRIRAQDLIRGKDVGGIRPQVVDIKQKKMILGEGRIVGENIIFNLTPSPGASTCLKNAEIDTREVLGFLHGNYRFDEAQFKKDFLF